MRKKLETPSGTVREGTILRITGMDAAAPTFPGGVDRQALALTGKTGKIILIDDAGQLHGTWGGLALIPGRDTFEILENNTDNIAEQ